MEDPLGDEASPADMFAEDSESIGSESDSESESGSESERDGPFAAPPKEPQVHPLIRWELSNKMATIGSAIRTIMDVVPNSPVLARVSALIQRAGAVTSDMRDALDSVNTGAAGLKPRAFGAMWKHIALASKAPNFPRTPKMLEKRILDAVTSVAQLPMLMLLAGHAPDDPNGVAPAKLRPDIARPVLDGLEAAIDALDREFVPAARRCATAMQGCVEASGTSGHCPRELAARVHNGVVRILRATDAVKGAVQRATDAVWASLRTSADAPSDAEPESDTAVADETPAFGLAIKSITAMLSWVVQKGATAILTLALWVGAILSVMAVAAAIFTVFMSVGGPVARAGWSLADAAFRATFVGIVGSTDIFSPVDMSESHWSINYIALFFQKVLQFTLPSKIDGLSPPDGTRPSGSIFGIGTDVMKWIIAAILGSDAANLLFVDQTPAEAATAAAVAGAAASTDWKAAIVSGVTATVGAAGAGLWAPVVGMFAGASTLFRTYDPKKGTETSMVVYKMLLRMALKWLDLAMAITFPLGKGLLGIPRWLVWKSWEMTANLFGFNPDRISGLGAFLGPVTQSICDAAKGLRALIDASLAETGPSNRNHAGAASKTITDAIAPGVVGAASKALTDAIAPGVVGAASKALTDAITPAADSTLVLTNA